MNVKQVNLLYDSPLLHLNWSTQIKTVNSHQKPFEDNSRYVDRIANDSIL